MAALTPWGHSLALALILLLHHHHLLLLLLLLVVVVVVGVLGEGDRSAAQR